MACWNEAIQSSTQASWADTVFNLKNWCNFSSKSGAIDKCRKKSQLDFYWLVYIETCNFRISLIPWLGFSIWLLQYQIPIPIPIPRLPQYPGLVLTGMLLFLLLPNKFFSRKSDLFLIKFKKKSKKNQPIYELHVANKNSNNKKCFFFSCSLTEV